MFAPFTDCSQSDIDRLVRDYPLAWLVTRNFNSAPLPLIAEHAEDGTIASLFGHCGRRNLIVADLRDDPLALILFNGPSGYISNRHVSEPNWGPTWNYAAVRFVAEVEFVEAETASSVDRLLDHLEGSDKPHWTPDQLGDRYENMLSQIIAFRAHVREVRPTFKLGQDERPDVLAEIVAKHENRDLTSWMKERARP
ncbi:FMN-binding negative transcriptional regulator [Croceicoccus naphthovorans]|uniref:Uncharacterized protein n=1 Tax=Croceicoccus naphthovorans TaxID=1348774 RepID=A0A0G3XD33_9SPHN|nr:FMN-binding negative transcriptional regulator [Croceicoccus naphthovorans]AKM09485.1 hypothetical protein AB433_05010 [Croceicoccus naphthovorans]MBB3991504.1 transcriptional regulator [Croceicoccus naphthovorans]